MSNIPTKTSITATETQNTQKAILLDLNNEYVMSGGSEIQRHPPMNG
ncbi:MAG: hypothetical protein ABI811_04465 [Acidobacteriota bacterium]